MNESFGMISFVTVEDLWKIHCLAPSRMCASGQLFNALLIKFLPSLGLSRGRDGKEKPSGKPKGKLPRRNLLPRKRGTDLFMLSINQMPYMAF